MNISRISKIERFVIDATFNRELSADELKQVKLELAKILAAKKSVEQVNIKAG